MALITVWISLRICFTKFWTKVEPLFINVLWKKYSHTQTFFWLVVQSQWEPKYNGTSTYKTQRKKLLFFQGIWLTAKSDDSVVQCLAPGLRFYAFALIGRWTFFLRGSVWMIQVLTERDNRSYHEVPVQTVVVLTFGYQSVETLPVKLVDS